MKRGFIVWNQTNYGDGFEFFGVFRSRKEAEKCLRRVLRERFGRVPKDMDELIELEGMENSYGITYFDSEERK